MVSADNLNLDCLELIFAYLRGNDLVSVSLVSRSFLAGVIPRLYRTLVFQLNQAKRYPSILSPFASVLAHRNLASHVRHIDIRTVPRVKSSPHPEFMRDCSRTIELCQNLVSFTCTPNVLPSFLFDLQVKESLQHMRINGSLTSDQAQHLVQIRWLKSIAVDTGTPHLVSLLPSWTASLKSTLTSLTLYCVHDLNEYVLGSVLANLSNLTGLHVVGCMKIDHHSILSHTTYIPLLESLSVTSWESPRGLPTYIHPLHHLKHLTVDTHCTLSPTVTPSFWNSIIALTRSWSCPLSSITLKLSDKLPVGDSFIQELLDAHEATLTHVALLNCALPLESVRSICTRCADLERIAISIPIKDIYSFAEALSRSKSLHTLSDIGDAHSVHGQKIFLSKADVRTIMDVVPSLRRVITDGRIWTMQKRRHNGSMSRIELERKKTPPVHWFMPQMGAYA